MSFTFNPFNISKLAWIIAGGHRGNIQILLHDYIDQCVLILKTVAYNLYATTKYHREAVPKALYEIKKANQETKNKNRFKV